MDKNQKTIKSLEKQRSNHIPQQHVVSVSYMLYTWSKKRNVVVMYINHETPEHECDIQFTLAVLHVDDDGKEKILCYQ